MDVEATGGGRCGVGAGSGGGLPVLLPPRLSILGRYSLDACLLKRDQQ